MSKTADVIIVGSGVIGCATAYYLAQKGTSVSSLTVMRVLEMAVLPEMEAVSASQAEIQGSCHLPCMQ